MGQRGIPFRLACLAVLFLGVFVCPAAAAERLIIGNDEKLIFDEAGAV